MRPLRRGSLLVFVSLLAACAAGGAAATTGPTPTVIASGSPDASAFAFGEDAGNDAGPLLAPCDPTTARSCPAGFTCYATHTSASWWVDLYGKCTFGCTSQTLALCSSMDGVCGCPVPVDGTSMCGGEGGTVAVPESEGGVTETEGGATPAPVTASSMVCVPAVKPGTVPGANDGDGGCGTPGCGGGAEAGSLPPTDSGSGGD
jgi:hypothetical protein